MKTWSCDCGSVCGLVRGFCYLPLVARLHVYVETRMASAARRADGTNQLLLLLDLPSELLQLVARFAFEDAYETGFAFSSRATMDATVRPLGLNSIFAVCTHAALAKIERTYWWADTRTLLRLRLVQRAIVAGNDAELFIWPAEAIDGPRPSPLREHEDNDPIGDFEHGTEYSLPLEHNFQVGLRHPDPTGECESRHAIDSLGWGWLGDSLGYVRARFDDGESIRALGKHVNAYQLLQANHQPVQKACLRRMAIRLVPNAC